MRDEALKRALREAPVPIPPDAEGRGRRVLEVAYAGREAPQRGSAGQRRPLPRLALTLGIATLLAALLLSPAGATVRDWVGDVVESQAPKPEPELARIPGGGRLLVQSAVGPWVVQPDGSRRLLGDYEEATWSPRGLFVAVAEGRTLSAVEPDGTPRWSITADGRVADPRWAPFGTRLAFRSGQNLRVVAGDGTGDRSLGPVAPVAPAWSPLDAPQLAYVDGGGLLRLVNSESGGSLASAPAGTDVEELEWGAGGSLILETFPRALRLQAVRLMKVVNPELGSLSQLPLPPRATLVDAALAPRRPLVATVITHWREHGTTSSVAVYGPSGKPRNLLTVPGSLGEVGWSPDGHRLLVAWPGADQWLFLPLGHGKPRAVANISTVFSPGERASSFPRLEGWCCRR